MKFTFDIEFDNDKIKINNCEGHRLNPLEGCADVGEAIYRYMKTIQNKIDGLYSKQIYFPKEVEFSVQYALSKSFFVYPTTHYFDKAKQLGINSNTYKALLYGEIIEAEFVKGRLVKIITRINNRYNFDEDICGAIAFDYDSMSNHFVARVKTVWENRTSDKHDTIDESKYVHKK